MWDKNSPNIRVQKKEVFAVYVLITTVITSSELFTLPKNEMFYFWLPSLRTHHLLFKYFGQFWLHRREEYCLSILSTILTSIILCWIEDHNDMAVLLNKYLFLRYCHIYKCWWTLKENIVGVFKCQTGLCGPTFVDNWNIKFCSECVCVCVSNLVVCVFVYTC